MSRSFSGRKYGRSGISKIVLVIVVVAILAVASAGAIIVLYKPGGSGTTTSSNQSVTLNGAGSTLVNPLMSAWTYNYTILNPTVRINYASIGSGAGITQLEAKVVDYGASDAPLNLAQYTAFTAGHTNQTGVVQIPEVAGAVVPAYNIPDSTTLLPTTAALNFTGQVLANIYLGKITNWNDPAIQQLNPGYRLPNATIFVVHRSDSSGTTFVWTDYLSQVSSVWNATVGHATAVNWPLTASSIGAKGSEGVSGVIQANPYAIGYMESAYATIDHLTYGAVQNAAGKFLLGNGTTAAPAVAAAASEPLPLGTQSWINVSIVDRVAHNASATNAYPITTFTYLMAYTHQTDQVKGTALVKFLWWIVNDVQSQVTTLGYVPLPASVVAIDDASIKQIEYNGAPLYTGT